MLLESNAVILFSRKFGRAGRRVYGAGKRVSRIFARVQTPKVPWGFPTPMALSGFARTIFCPFQDVWGDFLGPNEAILGPQLFLAPLPGAPRGKDPVQNSWENCIVRGVVRGTVLPRNLYRIFFGGGRGPASDAADRDIYK